MSFLIAVSVGLLYLYNLSMQGTPPLYTVVLYHTILCFTTSRPAASRVSEHRQASTRSSTADNHFGMAGTWPGDIIAEVRRLVENICIE